MTTSTKTKVRDRVIHELREAFDDLVRGNAANLAPVRAMLERARDDAEAMDVDLDYLLADAEELDDTDDPDQRTDRGFVLLSEIDAAIAALVESNANA